ncbi:hypothetical protein [Streptomyces sp. H27-H5]|uniref:hypothetical protein n=1 Tax=Streptomyces sp. H27-H5 TaxID=2996460 RepID=UPI0022712E67|nr:hypothetical protein [Streptomyces sp. H27-H5]MCY0961484.1 hypothetical protein [Streptomyces sp. H27-H5]
MTTDTIHTLYGRLADLQQRAGLLLAKSVARHQYDELVREAATGAAAARRELETLREVPPQVTAEEILDHHRNKAQVLRDVVSELGHDHFGEALAEAEAQLAALTPPPSS